jgi:hypothetical protein
VGSAKRADTIDTQAERASEINAQKPLSDGGKKRQRSRHFAATNAILNFTKGL